MFALTFTLCVLSHGALTCTPASAPLADTYMSLNDCELHGNDDLLKITGLKKRDQSWIIHPRCVRAAEG